MWMEKRPKQQHSQVRMVKNGSVNKGEGGTSGQAGQVRARCCGADVQSGVGETAAASGPPIVRLAGMQYNDLPRKAAMDAASVPEFLHPGRGRDHGVGVVGVRRKGAVRQSYLQRLHAGAQATGEIDIDARSAKTAGEGARHAHAQNFRRFIVGSQELVAFFLFSVTAALTPGPANILVMSAGLRSGILGGLPSLGGTVLGMGLLMGASGIGLGAVLVAYPAAVTVLKVLGAAVLLWLSWKVATAPPLRSQSMPDPIGFWRIVLFQWVNPKAWVVAASAAATYGTSAGAPLALRAALLAGTFMLAAAPSVGLWLVFGAALQRVLSSERRGRQLNLLMGLLLACSVVMLLV